MIFGVRGMRSLFRTAALSFFRIWPGMAIVAQFWHIRFFGGEQNNPDAGYRYSDRTIPVRNFEKKNDSEAVKRELKMRFQEN